MSYEYTTTDHPDVLQGVSMVYTPDKNKALRIRAKSPSGMPAEILLDMEDADLLVMILATHLKMAANTIALGKALADDLHNSALNMPPALGAH